MDKLAYIEKLPNGKWRVFSEKGKTLGTYPSKEQAKKRLAQIEMFKHIEKRKKSMSQIFSIIKNAQEERTFSSIMRDLNKNHPEKVKTFMSEFKKAFDEALEQSLENPDEIALMQAMQAINYSIKEAKIYKVMKKHAESVVEMGNPMVAGKTIANMIKYLVTKIPQKHQDDTLKDIKSRLLNVNVNELANKRIPPSASIGQSIAFIKNMLGGRSSEYISKVIQNTVQHL